MTAPTPSGRDDATLRGAVVLVVAIVIGLALLARGGSGGDNDADATTTEASGGTETTTFDGSQSTLAPLESSTTESPSGAHDPQDVTTIVLNGIPFRVDNAASDNTAKLSDAGYVTLEPAAANQTTDTTTIYSSADFASDASAVADVLGMPDAVLAEKPSEPLGPGAERADVVVVLGGDYSAG